MICKVCRKAFRKDLSEVEEADEYCPNCDNHYVIDAKTPAPMVGIEGEDARIDNRCVVEPESPSNVSLNKGIELTRNTAAV